MKFCRVMLTISCFLDIFAKGVSQTPPGVNIYFSPRTASEISNRKVTRLDPNVLTVRITEDATLQGCPGDANCELKAATDAIIQARSQVSPKKKLTVLVFTHGWKHNATWDDENYTNFRESIDCLNWGDAAYQEAYRDSLENSNDQIDHISCRGVQANPNTVYLGVYIGWNGREPNGDRSELTLSNRYLEAKKVAASDDTLRLFTSLHDAAKTMGLASPKARLIFVGHSFGGLITETIASRILSSDFLKNHLETCSDGSKGVAPYNELFLLVNPASVGYEGTLLIQRLNRVHYCPSSAVASSLRTPWLLSVHSNSDFATGRGGVFLRSILRMETGWDMSQIDDDIRPKVIRSSTLNNELFATNICYLDGTAMRANGSGMRTGSDYCEGIVSFADRGKAKAFEHANFSNDQRTQSYYDNPEILDGAYEILRESCGPSPYHPDRLPCSATELQIRDEQLKAMNDSLKDILAFAPIPSDNRPSHLMNLYILPDPNDLWNRSPYWVVNVSDLMIQGHGGFWNSEFTDFAGSVIDRIPDVQ